MVSGPPESPEQTFLPPSVPMQIVLSMIDEPKTAWQAAFVITLVCTDLNTGEVSGMVSEVRPHPLKPILIRMTIQKVSSIVLPVAVAKSPTKSSPLKSFGSLDG